MLSGSFYPLPPQQYRGRSHALASYRTLQLPLRPPDLPVAYNHQPRPAPFSMAYAQPDDELAQLQKLSNEYEPVATGPLVSERLSSRAITAEFANADPVYRIKTAALPDKYSYYRTCRGDGHCGWRAVAFSYFETLLWLGDKNKPLQEEIRLRSLASILNDVGHQEYLYEDFADATFDLLRSISAQIPVVDDGAALLATFNDEHLSLSIITYLKLLASAWIQTHPDEFQPYVNEEIREYCQRSIETSVCEIEHVGMSALVDVLVKPAGIAVEILYLDRTPGDKVNTYRFDPVDENGKRLADPPTSRLLYRPGHYDILYSVEDVHQPVAAPVGAQPPLFVGLANPPEHFEAPLGYYDPMTMIPGMSTTPLGGLPPDWGYGAFNFASTPGASLQTAPVPAYAPLPVRQPSHDFVNHSIPTETYSVPLAPPVSLSRDGPFRLSKWELEPELASSGSHTSSFQTAIFRNSHYNTAHFNNPDFQPEEWKPDAEYVTSSRPSSGRNRSSQ